MSENTLDYQASGVSIEAQDEAIAAFRQDVESTHGPEVVAGVGAFGAAFAPDLTGISNPVLVNSTDSLGTKTIVHSRFGTWENAGRDVVGCVVNDIIVSGARPLYFLDYLGINKVVPEQIHQMVGKGIAAACREIGCALIGGEIAEMRDVYKPGDFDLAGFAVGLVDRSRMLDGSGCREGSVLIGLESNGVHCNGFSLVRAAFSELNHDQWTSYNEDLDSSLAHALLQPTVCYANAVGRCFNAGLLQAAAHISGGGLQDNVPRVVPDGLDVEVDRSAISILPVFDIIQSHGNISTDEMWHVFNMGIGFALLVSPESAGPAMEICAEHSPRVIGRLVQGSGKSKLVFRD
ncbi:MAG: phosphoribosylformylglycinamidine cyclo-ligase [Planctomycetales bacterium]|nr:phosphoribosylformylglycinamidine cyclo-ligase [bacterium]UNM07129.1 MAG: phosphoribosylformylglycinamidine cyclo-ligase [Planctomycetales bacterium]